MVQEIKERDEVKKIFYLYCSFCNREIKGVTPNQVRYNFKIHMDKHKRDKHKRKNGNT